MVLREQQTRFKGAPIASDVGTNFSSFELEVATCTLLPFVTTRLERASDALDMLGYSLQTVTR